MGVVVHLAHRTAQAVVTVGAVTQSAQYTPLNALMESTFLSANFMLTFGLKVSPCAPAALRALLMHGPCGVSALRVSLAGPPSRPAFSWQHAAWVRTTRAAADYVVGGGAASLAAARAGECVPPGALAAAERRHLLRRVAERPRCAAAPSSAAPPVRAAWPTKTPSRSDVAKLRASLRTRTACCLLTSPKGHG